METNKNVGLYNRYRIEKVNGDEISSNAKYFVLRYDAFGSDLEHIKACQLALKVYAYAIKEHLPQLSKDLINELDKHQLIG